MLRNRIEVNDYCCILDKGSETTIVIFSAANTEKGKFSFYKSGVKSLHNIIFLNTIRNDWYLFGIPGIGNSVQESVKSISNFLNKLQKKQKNVITWGGSMGAYAAIYYGALIKEVSSIFAYGPELELGILHGKAYNFIDHSKKVNIYKIIYSYKKNYNIHCGTNDYMDMIGLTRLYNLKINHVNCYAIDNCNHALAPYIESKFGMNKIIEDYLNDKTNSLYSENNYKLLADEYVYDLLYKLMYLKKEILDIDIKQCKNTYMLDLLLFFKNRKEYAVAIEYINSSINKSPKNIFLYHKIILYKYNKKQDFNIEVIKLSNNIDNYYFHDTQSNQLLQKIVIMCLKKNYFSSIIKLYNSLNKPFLFLSKEIYIIALKSEVEILEKK